MISFCQQLANDAQRHMQLAQTALDLGELHRFWYHEKIATFAQECYAHYNPLGAKPVLEITGDRTAPNISLSTKTNKK